jgi:hypothetical protein
MRMRRREILQMLLASGIAGFAGSRSSDIMAAPATALAAASGPDMHNETEDDIFADYEKRFSLAMTSIPRRLPWLPVDKADIIATLRRCLGMRDEWIPQITPKVSRVRDYSGFSVEYLQFTSWPGCYGVAYLYVPAKAGATNKDAGPAPIVFLACGHGEGGKQSEYYRVMAEHLARHGIYVLVADNIGQGERVPMGHARPVKVFDYGLSVQGLIVMESIGWLNWIGT